MIVCVGKYTYLEETLMSIAVALLKLLPFLLLNYLYYHLIMSTLLCVMQKQAFRAQNLESAKSRLNLCADDIRDQLEKVGNTSELCSQLGAVLGMLGDCWYVFLLFFPTTHIASLLLLFSCLCIYLHFFSILITTVCSLVFVSFSVCRILLLYMLN